MIINFSDNEKRYEQADFYKEAAEIIDNTIENEEVKKNIVANLAEQIAKTVNKAGISASFDITEEFMQKIFDETAVGLVSDGFFAFVSDDGVYGIHVVPAPRPENLEDSSPCVVEISVSRMKYGKMQVFDGHSEWIDREAASHIMFRRLAKTVEEVSQVPREVVMQMEDEDEIGFDIGLDYLREDHKRTIEDWKLFKEENEKLITLIKKKKDILDFRILNGRLYAVPADHAHFGIMLGYEDGKYEIFQNLSVEQIFEHYGDRNLVDYIKDKVYGTSFEEGFIKKAGEIENLYEAMQFAEAHMDRNTSFTAAVTIPISKDLVLHLDDEVLDRPDIIWNRLGKSNKNRYLRRNVKELVGFLNGNRDFIMSMTRELLHEDRDM